MKNENAESEPVGRRCPLKPTAKLFWHIAYFAFSAFNYCLNMPRDNSTPDNVINSGDGNQSTTSESQSPSMDNSDLNLQLNVKRQLGPARTEDTVFHILESSIDNLGSLTNKSLNELTCKALIQIYRDIKNDREVNQLLISVPISSENTWS